ncbi:hypothetical protein GS399_10725 [Pedobacter sp. HMF7647]|uniref:Lipoprotein n=1 Tax=Hufsiella arboris TaxID=2695275 RepID=A0A7K1YA41_9SPHI|nr:hypothetical protein [Hufsiella arboris]MXV51444.1 hypothetical protein [Hufsiella arboris]
MNYKALAIAFMAIAFSSCIRISFKTPPVSGDSTQNQQSVRVNSKYLISCDGIGEVKLYDTYQDLVNRYGANALTVHENNVSGNYSVIWEGQATEMTIVWKEKQEPFKNISYLKINSDFSSYQTRTGLRLGANRDDMQKANGDLSVTFKNFNDENNPGEITSFNHGSIEQSDNCIGGVIDLTAKRNIDVKELAAFNKEKTISTAHRLMDRMDITLTEISVGKSVN